MARHNKKRNTGLLYEFIAKFIANSIVENDEGKRNQAFKIIKEHFKKGTELYREFRLFNALVSTTVSSEAIATNIISEAKLAARQYDAKKLDYEKSMLIRSINHNLKGGNAFYNQPVQEYKEYATVQQLINEWRDGLDGNLVKIAEYEDNLKGWLLKEKVKTGLKEHVSDDADTLVVRIMTNKFNDRYKDLGDEERSIIRSYVFQEHRDELVPRLEKMKADTLSGLDKYLERQDVQTNKQLTQKLTSVKETILKESIETITDKTIEHFLDIAKLKEEVCQEN